MIDFELRPYPGEDEISYIKRKAYFFRILKSRMNYGNKAIEKKLISAVPLTSSDIEGINSFWQHYMSPIVINQLIDYRYYSVFKSAIPNNEQLCKYIPDTFCYLFIDDYYTNPQFSNPCDDKNLHDLYFYDINRPKTIFRKIGNVYLDGNYNVISLAEVVHRVKNHDEVVLKISQFSCGGKGVFFWNSEKDNEDVLISFLNSSNQIICQEAVKQHPLMDELNPSSVNTIRLLTLFFKDEVHVISSAIRFGINGNRTDNINSGGLACGLDSDGRLKDVAYDICARKFTHHPNGKLFGQYQIPNYHQCVELVTQLAKRYLSVTKMISWDIALDKDGTPLIIESNLSFNGLNFHQICNGPLFGDMTEDVLKDVFKNSYTLNSILKSMQ